MMSATSKVWWMLGALGLAVGSVWADPSILRNPPSDCGDGPGQTQCNQCDSANAGPQPENVDVGFPGGGISSRRPDMNVKAGASSSTGGMGASSAPGGSSVENGCVQVTIPLGRASVMSDSRGISLRIYTSTASPALFTPEELRVVMGYSFNALGSDRTSKGVPAAVLFNQAQGEPIRFVFGEGESLGIPDPGVHVELDERVQMVDAEGWATAEDPVYYDLYPGDGSVWRFYATDITGRLGELVSYTDPRGRVITAADFGVEILRGSNGLLRQVVTPSRLADIVMEGETSYTVKLYPLTASPAFGEGVYVPPAGVSPIETLTVARGEDDRHLNVTVRKGTGDARLFRYVYVGNDWTLTRPSGVEEMKEMMYGDDENAMIGKTVKDAQGMVLSMRKTYLTEAPWGGYMKHWTAEGIWEVTGAADVAHTNRWDYVMNGPAKGKVSKATAYTGKVTTFAYDELARVIREAEGDGTVEARVTTNSYAPVAEGDRTSLRDTRPRCVVVTERDPESGEQVEVARSYWAYLPTQEIHERAATAGAAYGAAGALRTVKTWYAPDDATPTCAGRLKSIRYEDGRLELYAYALVEGEIWKKTVTFLHEEAPEPVSGKTLRNNILYDRVGNIIERNQEAFIDGAWHLIDRLLYVYDSEGHVIRETDFAGRVTTIVWGGSCCGKTSMTLPNGTRFTYAYDDEGRLIAETKLDPIPCTTHTEYNALGRVVKTWKDGLNPETTGYDIFGQVVAQIDVRGGITQTGYNFDGRSVITTFPNGGDQIRKTDELWRLLETFGTAVQPQRVTYGPNWRKSATGARWQRTEQNLLGQTVRQTRSGANGSTLETSMAYDNYGRISQISETGQPVHSYTYNNVGERTTLTQTVGEEWRKLQSEAEYLLREGNVWRKQTAVLSCSDADIAPLTQTVYTQLSGLSVTNTFNQIVVDIRGNETRTFGNDTQRTTLLPSCSNPQIERYAFGQLVETVDTACVTNRFEYDALDRRVAAIDGRNNRTVYTYDAKNNLVSVTDAVGAVTAYGYDVMGQTIAVTNALGNVTVYQYDLQGNKTYEGGATYPVRYTYDVFGNKTIMKTYRDEASYVYDTTIWGYDAASGVLLAKTYDDGKGQTYTYTDDGKLATRTNARGIVTTYTYDDWGQLLAIDYADATPDIAYTYDAMGRQTSVTDAVGTTTFTYDAFGQLSSEQLSGLYSKTLTRHWDAFGRNVGYSVDNERKQSIVYDSATGRISESDGFKWTYLPGTNLKSQLTYPNDAVVTWTYEPHRNLLTTVTNATYSTYVYTNDLLGRRTSKNDEQYGYNVRDELISADNVSYAYDDIGNRTTAEGKTYTANNLNQYIAIDDFAPQYDDDGNQTLIKTETGIWSVVYNAENRPVRWQSGDTVITMAFDRMGRRVEMRTVKDGEETLQRFVYGNYLCIQQLRGAENALYHSYIWDPTEPIATRPLIFRPASGVLSYYFHDGNKNVSDLVDTQGNIVHYAYTPFGSSTTSASSENPFRFSSEVHDDTLALVYYNYRHYNPQNGRWITRDPLTSAITLKHEMSFCNNAGEGYVDVLGLWNAEDHEAITEAAFPNKKANDPVIESLRLKSLDKYSTKCYNAFMEEFIKYNNDTDSLFGGLWNNALHFNRTEEEDVSIAINAYRVALQDRKTKFKQALEGRNCTEALKHMGSLAHSYQDFYMHAASSNNEVGFLAWTKEYSGTPETPNTLQPSIWEFSNLFASSSESINNGLHPLIGEPLNGSMTEERLREYNLRKEAAIIETVQSISPLMSLFDKQGCICEICVSKF